MTKQVVDLYHRRLYMQLLRQSCLCHVTYPTEVAHRPKSRTRLTSASPDTSTRPGAPRSRLHILCCYHSSPFCAQGCRLLGRSGLRFHCYLLSGLLRQQRLLLCTVLQFFVLANSETHLELKPILEFTCRTQNTANVCNPSVAILELTCHPNFCRVQGVLPDQVLPDQVR